MRLIDHYPGEDELAFICEESRSTGGCAYNVICDLRAIDPDLPLHAIGVVGEDEDAISFRTGANLFDLPTLQLR